MATTTESVLTRLATLCVEDSRGITKAPFTVERAGRAWTGATNGDVLMLVDAQSTADAAPDSIVAFMATVIDNWPATGHIPRAALRTWVGGVDDPKECPDCHGAPTSRPVECEQCDGTGHAHECEDCEHNCPDCDGDGTVDEEACDHGLPARSYGAVTDGTRTVKIDRAVLAPLLALMTGDAVEVALAGPEEPVRFRGDGWRAALMPVRHGVVVGPPLTLEAEAEREKGR